ncbi:hypothetical protein EYF80_000270 [Liparis tanakae]|uniref:Uncharacterized protein n=1 Tax=Liparis tanakae TaxID=230148 RepID=A0A4Z2JI66_9TELE|nr:hypothetical protein EYF80_000270 [Liparis tanakae]
MTGESVSGLLVALDSLRTSWSAATSWPLPSEAAAAPSFGLLGFAECRSLKLETIPQVELLQGDVLLGLVSVLEEREEREKGHHRYGLPGTQVVLTVFIIGVKATDLVFIRVAWRS